MTPKTIVLSPAYFTTDKAFYFQASDNIYERTRRRRRRKSGSIFHTYQIAIGQAAPGSMWKALLSF